jgi:hypothetical protein
VYCGGNPVVMVDENGEFWFVPVIVGALIGGYAGGAIANDHGNPLKWDWDSKKTWSGIGIGALSGAFLGSGISVGGTYGMGVGSSGFNTLGGYMGGDRGSSLLKYAAVGFATGYFGASGGLGMVGSKNTALGYKIAGRLGTQMLTTAGRSIGNNWAAGRDPFGSFMVGVGPINLRVGTNHAVQLNLKDNILNAFSNGVGLLTSGLSMIDSRWKFGSITFDYKNSLSFNYQNELLGKMVNALGAPANTMGLYSIWNSVSESGYLNEEGNHVWQSRIFNRLFVPTYTWATTINWISNGVYYDQFFENQAYRNW